MIFEPAPLAHAVLLAVCLVCAWTDLRRQEIYDWATVPGMVIGVAAGWIMHGTDGMISAVVGGLVGFGVFGLLWYLRLMASGDVFLMGAAGALLRFPAVLYAMLFASLLGVVVAVIWTAAHGQLGQVLRNMRRMVAGLWRKADADGQAPVEKTPFPFGIAIAGGAVWAAGISYFPWLAIGLV
jgi:Flp pilus assembly protein protease CpaA